MNSLLVGLLLALSLAPAVPRGAKAQGSEASNILPRSIRLHLISWHDRAGYDNANVGAALRWNGGFVLGALRNSFGRPSWYGGVIVPLFQKHAFQAELMAGLITGYSDTNPVDVVAVPSLGWRLSPRTTVQVVLIPRLVIPANAVHVMFERRLGGGGSSNR